MRRIRRMIIVWEVEDKILISEGKSSRSGRGINLYSQLVLISNFKLTKFRHINHIIPDFEDSSVALMFIILLN